MKRVLSCILALCLMLTVAYATGEVFSKKDYKEMTTRGIAVADLQNQYPGTSYDAKTYNLVFKLMQQYVSDDAGCKQWFGSTNWKFVTDTVTDTDSQDVLWLGYNDEGDITAYVSGVYSRTSQKFGDITLHRVASVWEDN